MDRMESFNLHRKKRAELRLRMDERKTELIIVNAPSAQKGEVLLGATFDKKGIEIIRKWR